MADRTVRELVASRRVQEAALEPRRDKSTFDVPSVHNPGMEINGIAHVILTVRDVRASRAFYRSLLAHMGLTEMVDTDEYLYFVGGRTAVGLRPARADAARDRFDQGRPGLHHVCFRARSRDDVDAMHALAVSLGARIVHPPEEGGWVPGYYSVLFEDPDGIRLEVNYVPGKGVFEPGVGRVNEPKP